MSHRFTLEKSSKKYNCPGCSKRRFVRYIDTHEIESIPAHVGRCDRETSCGYHYSIKEYFADNPTGRFDYVLPFHHPQEVEELHHVIPLSIMEASISPKHHKRNNFLLWLASVFKQHQDIIQEVVELYKVGTSKHWEGATVFWQVDDIGEVRQAKIMHYNPETGKRTKQHENPQPGRSKIYFAGKAILAREGVEDPKPKQFLFGAHLVKLSPSKPIGIVESEKTAIIMTIFSALKFAPDYCWIATGGKHGAKWYSEEANNLLFDRDVILFPDLGAMDDWQTKVNNLVTANTVEVSNYLREVATNEEQKDGLDIADYFLKEYSKSKKQNKPTILSRDERVLSNMVEQNPLVNELIDRFDLTFMSRP